MRKLTTIFLLLLLSIACWSQTDTTKKLMSRQDYLARSRGQMIGGFILLGIGATCAAIAAPGNVSFETLGTLVVVGGLATLGSIPLLIAAGRNKRRARRASASIDLQKSLIIQPNSYAFHYYPAVKLKFRL